MTLMPLQLPQSHWRCRWLVTGTRKMLHRVSSIKWLDENIEGHGVTVCGFSGHLHAPRLFERLAVERCPVCCRAIGIPQGLGAPVNVGIVEPGDDRTVLLERDRA